MNDELEQLKKSYWGRFSSKSFWENKEGQRLFCLGGSFSPTYFIDTDDTEIRLRKKLITYHKWMVISAIVVVILFNQYWVTNGIIFFGLLFAFVAIRPIWFKTVLADDVSRLQKVEGRMQLKNHYSGFEERFALQCWGTGFIGSVSLVATGLGMILSGDGSARVWLPWTLFFGICSVVCGRAFLVAVKEFRKNTVGIPRK